MSVIADFTHVSDPALATELKRLQTRVQQAVSGKWTAVSYRIDRFTADVGSWLTVQNLSVIRMQRQGSSLLLDFDISGTDVTDTPVELRIALPDGLTSTVRHTAAIAALDDGTPVPAVARVEAGGTYVRIWADLTGATMWTTSTGGTSIAGQLGLEVRP